LSVCFARIEKKSSLKQRGLVTGVMTFSNSWQWRSPAVAGYVSWWRDKVMCWFISIVLLVT